jgi:DNA repair exonuclease SbcCD ATPase subunit
MTIQNEKKHDLPLQLNLQFFAEETNEGNNAEPSDGSQNTDTSGVNNTNNSAPAQDTQQQQDISIPKTRFDEVNNKYKEVKAQLDELLAAKTEAEKKAQAEQGKFKELYEGTSNELTEYKSKYESTESRAKELESVIGNLLTAKLEGIDETYHDLIPDNLSVEQKLDWINKAEQKGLFKKEQQPIGEGTNPSQTQAVDVGKMSIVQMLKAGYGAK